MVSPATPQFRRGRPSPESSRPELADLRRVLARDVARRFKRITGQVIVVTPIWKDRAERKKVLRAWADHPICKRYQHERACIRCRLSHLRNSMTDDAHPVHHRCAFGHTCVFTPLSVDGQCVAYCKFALESDAAVDRYVELLDVLAENACSHLTEHDNHCVIHPAPEHVKKDQSIDFSGDGWSEVVHRAVELIDEQFADPDLTVACVARRLCLNRDYLSHLFRVQTGQRMSRHIFLRRMQQARKLLMTTDFQVRQIALDSGFLNTDWFSHTFHELEGITPSQFRRNARRQNDTPAPRH